MTAGVKLLPMGLETLMCFGMHKFRRDLDHRAKNETEAQYVWPRQSDWWLVHYQIIVEQQVDIERSRRISPRGPVPPGGALNFLQIGVDFPGRERRMETNDHVQKIISIKTVSSTSVHGRCFEFLENSLERLERKLEIFPGLYIAAQT
jgi:hypothetical protein